VSRDTYPRGGALTTPADEAWFSWFVLAPRRRAEADAKARYERWVAAFAVALREPEEPWA